MSFYTISHWEADEWTDEMEAIIAAALSFESCLSVPCHNKNPSLHNKLAARVENQATHISY